MQQKERQQKEMEGANEIDRCLKACMVLVAMVMTLLTIIACVVGLFRPLIQPLLLRMLNDVATTTFVFGILVYLLCILFWSLVMEEHTPARLLLTMSKVAVTVLVSWLLTH